jgi:hypothetical protein
MADAGSNRASSTNEDLSIQESETAIPMSFTEAQNDVVRAIAADMGRSEWERIFVDAEILEQPDGYDIDTVSFVIVRDAAGDLSDPQFSLGADARKAISALYKQRQAEAGEKIGGFELKVDFPGKFAFKYNHEKPKRLNGIWDQQRQDWLDNYLQHYKAEIGE